LKETKAHKTTTPVTTPCSNPSSPARYAPSLASGLL
jgi:hypothetical protein